MPFNRENHNAHRAYDQWRATTPERDQSTDRKVWAAAWQAARTTDRDEMRVPAHFVSATCRGETCTLCQEQATHKVGEEIPFDVPNIGMPNHNMTAYICCWHFGLLMKTVCRPAAPAAEGEVEECR